jgi:hypothetical protein
VPSVQLQAPLGTYLGWNTFRAGVFAGHGCGFQGGWIPFATTKADRVRNGDPRPSLEERYGTHDGYVAAVRKATEQAVEDRFLLPDDAARLLREAEASTVLEQRSLSPLPRLPVDEEPVARGHSRRRSGHALDCRRALKARPTDPTGPEARSSALRLEAEYLESNQRRKQELLAEAQKWSAAYQCMTAGELMYSRQQRAPDGRGAPETACTDIRHFHARVLAIQVRNRTAAAGY